MRMTTINKLIGLATAATLLTACSIAKPTHGQDANAAPTTAAADNGNAQTYALQGSPNATASNGMQQNAITAPSNQTYYFAFDNSNMRPQDDQALRIQSNYLATHPKAKVMLQGNTDDRGSREYNVGLGWRRDQAVARFMEQQGVRPGQIDMISFGKERPAVPGENEQAWALNRRVNLVYKAY